MTASASRTVARASVTRFIENLPCSHCDRRNEGSTDGGEYSCLGKLYQSDAQADAAADGIIFQLSPVWPRAEPQASLARSDQAIPAAEIRRSARIAWRKPARPVD